MLDLMKDPRVQPIRTLGIYQPFATLMLHGKVETRFVGSIIDKKTQKRKWLTPPFPLGIYLIYSTKKCYGYGQALGMMDDDQQADAEDHFRWEVDLVSKGTIDPVSRDFILGHAISIGKLVSIIDPVLPETENTFVRYVPPCTRRRVGLVFEEMTRIKPFPFSEGKQGIGFLSPEDLQKIEFV